MPSRRHAGKAAGTRVSQYAGLVTVQQAHLYCRVCPPRLSVQAANDGLPDLFASGAVEPIRFGPLVSSLRPAETSPLCSQSCLSS